MVSNSGLLTWELIAKSKEFWWAEIGASPCCMCLRLDWEKAIQRIPSNLLDCLHCQNSGFCEYHDWWIALFCDTCTNLCGHSYLRFHCPPTLIVIVIIVPSLLSSIGLHFVICCYAPASPIAVVFSPPRSLAIGSHSYASVGRIMMEICPSYWVDSVFQKLRTMLPWNTMLPSMLQCKGTGFLSFNEPMTMFLTIIILCQQHLRAGKLRRSWTL